MKVADTLHFPCGCIRQKVDKRINHVYCGHAKCPFDDADLHVKHYQNSDLTRVNGHVYDRPSIGARIRAAIKRLKV